VLKNASFPPSTQTYFKLENGHATQFLPPLFAQNLRLLYRLGNGDLKVNGDLYLTYTDCDLLLKELWCCPNERWKTPMTISFFLLTAFWTDQEFHRILYYACSLMAFYLTFYSYPFFTVIFFLLLLPHLHRLCSLVWLWWQKTLLKNQSLSIVKYRYSFKC